MSNNVCFYLIQTLFVQCSIILLDLFWKPVSDHNDVWVGLAGVEGRRRTNKNFWEAVTWKPLEFSEGPHQRTFHACSAKTFFPTEWKNRGKHSPRSRKERIRWAFFSSSFFLKKSRAVHGEVENRYLGEKLKWERTVSSRILVREFQLHVRQS